jgi:uncharacterized protein YfaP (DUF2135 family)
MQALKQAARESDQVKLDAVCEEWSVSMETDRESQRNVRSVSPPVNMNETAVIDKAEGAVATAASVEIRR